MKREIIIRRQGFLEKLSDSKLADLEFKTCPQLAPIFISRKQRRKIFGGVLPVMRLQQIITPKLSKLMHTREGTTIVTQQEKFETKPDD